MVGNDFLARQGTRAFATRLRRLHEQLNQGVLAAYRAAGFDFEPRWFGLITLVRAHANLEVAQAAAALGQSHVAIVQVANALEERGLIRRIPSRSDKRRKPLAITVKGEALCKKLDPFWDVVRRATDRLLEEASPEFLSELGALERALSENSLEARIQELMPKKGRPS
jgi:DNA-binding MarR family transcriptional regulator